ncbi:hypothetical protein NSE01_35030 [Novosphingobium sediminis]|uniref:DUF4178 domain-containing protein n=1 Tax=Novosphingobium sediminis TaxID=707214 RepID=A0A512APQ0_9SPHN|nr:DUF4178 domain-containing protein [Novosphingobium sediminis]GEO01671.1 hypothetical protein NSE01_35030 [Novosphingobium sediminis]
MENLTCPSCGAALPVRDPGLPYSTCAYCQTLVRRGAGKVEAIGTVATLPADVSPIQIGTTVDRDGIAATVVGRVRWGWSDGSWNEWFLRAADGRAFWLGEAMGMYMLTSEYPAVTTVPAIQNFAQGNPMARDCTVKAGGKWLTASDIKEAECLGSEGDLPFPALPGRTMTNADFRNAAGDALSVQRDADGTTAWLGVWSDLAGLKPGNLRQIEGWTMPKALA